MLPKHPLRQKHRRVFQYSNKLRSAVGKWFCSGLVGIRTLFVQQESIASKSLRMGGLYRRAKAVKDVRLGGGALVRCFNFQPDSSWEIVDERGSALPTNVSQQDIVFCHWRLDFLVKIKNNLFGAALGLQVFFWAIPSWKAAVRIIQHLLRQESVA